MINPEMLQTMLRQFGGPLEAAEVKPHPLAPHLATISWVCSFEGHPYVGEVEHFDLRSLHGADDVLLFASQVLRSLEEGAKQAPAR